MDSLTDQRALREEEIGVRFDSIVKILSLLRIKDYKILQISKSRLFKERDTNSGFFHAYVKIRSRINIILALKVCESWIEGVSEIREVFNYFYDIFKEPNADRPRFDEVIFHIFYDEDNIAMITLFTLQELYAW